ncbi:MAG: glycosyltransferase [Phycisphaerales bacterium]|nr:glycosyltransferase [Phycisphaerales bacterium]
MSTAVSAAVKLVPSHPQTDHFLGVGAALTALGVTWGDTCDIRLTTWIEPQTSAVVVSNCECERSLRALRECQKLGVASLLVMDGITEWRNTFINPRVGAGFLKPAPADRVLCAGELDEAVLRALGNDAAATGLPRIVGAVPAGGMAPAAGGSAVLVCTANQPYFLDDEKPRLLAALAELRDALRSAGVPGLWRVREDLAAELGVERAAGTLAENLRAAAAVVTTPSTVMVEAMRAGRPVGLLHPQPTPLWQTAAFGYRGAAGSMAPAHDPRPDATAAAKAVLERRGLPALDELAAPTARAFVDELLAPPAERMALQGQVLGVLHHEAEPAAEAVARAIAEAVKCPPVRRAPSPATSIGSSRRLPPRVPKTPGKPRVLNCLFLEQSPVGGVTVWAQRLAREFAERNRRYDVRTLMMSFVEMPRPDELTEMCVLDPTDDHTELLRSAREAIERLEPDIVLPNYSDITYCPAQLLHRRGVRVVSIAHTDEPYYRMLAETYRAADAYVGVSRATEEWLRPIAGERPLERIVYAVPVAERPRDVPRSGPLRIAYIGRMIEWQKRLSDFLTLVDHLEDRRCDYELHMVGDGMDYDRFLQSLWAKGPLRGRVVTHGRKTPEWVQAFLPTIDVSVLLSEYEGTSITMLEAMAFGVVPAVTTVSSGVDEWVRDDENGVTAPVGAPRVMAERLWLLSRRRDELARLGRAAWETARAKISMQAMGDRYEALFDRVMASPHPSPISDACLRLVDTFRWRKDWSDDPRKAEALAEAWLREAGFRAIARERPEPGCDAVLVPTNGRVPRKEELEAWRASGLGVAVAPHLMETNTADLLAEQVSALQRRGCRRIGIFGIGNHTLRARGLFRRGLPIVAFLDDRPPPSGRFFGLPVEVPEEAVARLGVDGIVLSSDAFEAKLWARTAGLRRRGIPVVAIYGSYDEEAARAASALPSAA